MKKYIFLLLGAAFLFDACDEIPPVTKGSSGTRTVLIEEFTGVRCVQCPAGSVAIQDLLALHGDRLVAVSIHAGDFSPPYPNSQYDFRTEEGSQLINYLDVPFGYPSASIDRKLFPGQFDLQLGQGDWAGFISSELAIEPKLRINVEPSFDAGTRELKATVKLLVDETIPDADVRLSLMITESEIHDLQITPTSATPIPDYTHRHVLRGMMTNWDGDPIGEPLTQGAVVEKNFTFTMPEEWKEEHCEIVAFVSLAGSSKEVLQAQQVPVIE
jgi:hypothetical protein